LASQKYDRIAQWGLILRVMKFVEFQKAAANGNFWRSSLQGGLEGQKYEIVILSSGILQAIKNRARLKFGMLTISSDGKSNVSPFTWFNSSAYDMS
jgi:hypothetical protein